MKALGLILVQLALVLTTAVAFAGETTYICKPTQDNKTVQDDHKLVLGKYFIKHDRILWGHTDSKFPVEFDFDGTAENLKFASIPQTDFWHVKKTDQLIIVSSREDLYIDSDIMEGADSGYVIDHYVDGNLLENTSNNQSYFYCTKQ